LYKKAVPYQLRGRRVLEWIKEVIESNKVLHFVSRWCGCCQSQWHVHPVLSHNCPAHTPPLLSISLSPSLSGRYFVHKRNLPLQKLSYPLASMQYLEMDLNQVTLDQKAWEDWPISLLMLEIHLEANVMEEERPWAPLLQNEIC
jgi:hypothetical protein